MLKQRLSAATKVASAFRDAEDLAQQSAIASSRLHALIIEERATAKLPPETAIDEQVELAEAALHASRAHATFLRVHPRLRDVPKQIGITAWWYGGDDCPPNTPRPTGVLPAREQA